MEKKTVTISERTIKSLFIGLFVGVLSVFIIHFFGSWSARPPETNSFSGADRIYTNDTKISLYTLYCPLDDMHVFQGKGATFDDIVGGHFSEVKFKAILSATYDEHWKNIFSFGLIAAVIIYLVGTFKVKVVNNKDSSKI